MALPERSVKPIVCPSITPLNSGAFWPIESPNVGAEMTKKLAPAPVGQWQPGR